jgi:hypothetical protein
VVRGGDGRLMRNRFPGGTDTHLLRPA